MSTMYRETPWACRHQALFDAIIHLWPPCEDVAGISLSENAGKWSSLMQNPVTFPTPTQPSTLMSHICKVWDEKVPSPSTSTWQLLGDTNSWWKVVLRMRRWKREWQTERMKEGEKKGQRGREIAGETSTVRQPVDSNRDEYCAAGDGHHAPWATLALH